MLRNSDDRVESFFIILGYEKIIDIKHRQGRIDISIHVHGEIKIVVEVKRDWNLTINNSRAVNQAYNYANECGAKYVLLTLEEQTDDIKQINASMMDIKLEIREIKTKVAMRAAFIGATIPTIIGLVGLAFKLIHSELMTTNSV